MACECVSCRECGGSGTIWISFSGKYLGNHRCDDLDSLDSCEECGGSGLTEMCDECRDRMHEEQDREADYWANQEVANF